MLILKTILLAVLLPLLAVAQTATVIPTGPASFSGTAPVTVTIVLTNSPATAASGIEFNWAAGQPVASIALAASAAPTMRLTCGGTFPQTGGTCIVYRMDTSTMPNGPVSVVVTAPANSSTPLTFATSAVLAADPSGSNIVATGGNLAILPALSKCDLNGDGTVDGTDVTIIAQRISTRPQPVRPCDFDGNVSCDLFDLFVILKAALPGGVCTAP